MSANSQKLDTAVEQLSDFQSPYRLSKIESAMRGKTIPPQKLYGYVRQGYIVASTNSTGKIQIERAEAARYLATQAK